MSQQLLELFGSCGLQVIRDKVKTFAQILASSVKSE